MQTVSLVAIATLAFKIISFNFFSSAHPRYLQTTGYLDFQPKISRNSMTRFMGFSCNFSQNEFKKKKIVGQRSSCVCMQNASRFQEVSPILLYFYTTYYSSILHEHAPVKRQRYVSTTMVRHETNVFRANERVTVLLWTHSDKKSCQFLFGKRKEDFHKIRRHDWEPEVMKGLFPEPPITRVFEFVEHNSIVSEIEHRTRTFFLLKGGHHSSLISFFLFFSSTKKR